MSNADFPSSARAGAGPCRRAWRRPVASLLLGLFLVLGFSAGAQNADAADDTIQMSFAKRALAEFGNDKDDAGGARVVVEIGDGAKLSNEPRTINYTVSGSADRGDGKDYTIDGCTSSTCSVKLPANRHSAVITIYVNDDGLVETDETIVFTLQDGDRYTVNNARKTTTVTIRDDDTRGLTFHRRWPDVPEGGSQTYTVKLKSQPTAAVTVKIASDNPDVTVDKSSLTFTTSNWKTTQTVRVSAAQDSDAVDDEATLTHTTSGGDYGGANALSIGRSVSVDDDDPRTTTVVPQLPRISLTGGAAVTEGSPASFTVNADRAPTARLTVNLEVVEPGGGDFVAASEEGVRTVTLNAGATSTTFTVPTVNDNTEEVDGAVLVRVNAGTGYRAGDGDLVNVNDNDGGGPPPTTPAASFASASSSAAEDAGTRNVRVNLSPAAPSGGLTLSYSVAGTATAGNGNDFTIAGSGSLSVAPGATTADIPVAIRDDSIAESAETVILTLTGGTDYTLGSQTVHTLTINDNDGPPGTPAVEFASASSSAAENAGTRNVTVNLSPAAPSGGLTLAYSVSGTATAGSGNDFTIQNSGTVTVTAGAASATIPVAINDDSSTESAETVILTLTGGTGYTLGGTTIHTLTITDNDGGTTPTTPVASFASASSSAAENAGTRNVTVSLSPAAPSGGLTLGYNVSGTATAGSGNDFTIQNSGTLSVAPGATTASIPVAIRDDSIAESAETVILTLTSGTGYTLGSTTVYTLTITDNDGRGTTPPPPPPPPTTPDPGETPTTPTGPEITVQGGSAVTEGGDAVFTVSASPAPASALTVTVTVAANGDFLAQADEGEKTVTIAGGETSATLTVPTQDDSQDEADGSVTATLQADTGYTLASPSTATVAVSDNDEPPAIIPVVGIAGGSAVTEGGDAVFTISTNPAPASALTVTVTVADDASSDFLAQADEGEKTVTIAGGETSATLTLTTQDDSADEADGSVTATLQADTGYTLASSSTATVAVSDNDDETPAPVVTPGAQADPAAWLARFGRMVAGQALDGITGRMAAARRAGLAGNIGGRALGFGPDPTAGADETGAAPESADVFEGGGPVNAVRLSLSDMDRMFGTGRTAGAARSLTGRDLMLGSRFTLTGERDAMGGSLAFWGEAAQSGFDGREGRVSLDGKATTAMLGADYARDRWLAGMALMQSGGKGDYRDKNAGAGSGGGGDVETTLTAALPYASLQVSERMKLWGALGHGTGEVTLKPEPGRTLKSDLSWTMAATGLRSEVIPPPEEGSGPALALVSDALWAGTSSDKAHELAASDSDVTRLRLGLEGSWTMALQEGGRVTPKLEAGLRHDDGDAETGFGVELGGGLAWVDPRLGLSLDLSGRMLVTHGADDLEDRGFAASLAFDPDPSTERGLSLALRQERGGQATGGLDALFRADPLRERTGSEKDTRWTAEAAWGFVALDRRFTGSPHVGLGIATGARDYTLGWRLTPEAGAPDLGFGVTATRRESDGAAPEHGIGVQLNTRW